LGSAVLNPTPMPKKGKIFKRNKIAGLPNKKRATRRIETVKKERVGLE